MDDVRVAESDSRREVSEDLDRLWHYELQKLKECLDGKDGKECMDGLMTGDMVWGKVNGHPWWPGYIFNESFATSSVRRTRRGHVLVAFFRDSSYGWLKTAELLPFEPFFTEMSRQATSRTFVKAVEEAVDEVSRRAALGLACCCRNRNNFRPTEDLGWFAVDVVGFEPSGLYSWQQIKRARDDFVPGEVLSFLNELAVVPQVAEQKNVNWIRSMSMLLAYRKAVFEEFDETYAQAFGVQPVCPTQNSMGLSDQPDRFAPRGEVSVGPKPSKFQKAKSVMGRKQKGSRAGRKQKGSTTMKQKKPQKLKDETEDVGYITGEGYRWTMLDGLRFQESKPIIDVLKLFDRDRNLTCLWQPGHNITADFCPAAANYIIRTIRPFKYTEEEIGPVDYYDFGDGLSDL